MRKFKFVNLLFAALCCLLMCSQAQAQQAFGYTAITFNPSTNTATGYASTEVDYETAYYYDAEVQARIENENGTVLGSGGTIGNPSASTFFDVINLVFCFRITIISFVIVRPHFLGCDRDLFDAFGFSDFWWGWFWDFGDFSLSRRNRCILERLIFIATIVRELIRCLPAEVTCNKDTNQLLPTDLDPNTEIRYISGLVPGVNNSDRVTIRCHAQNPVTRDPQSGVTLRFQFANVFPTDGGHQNHTGTRPPGTYTDTVKKTDSNGDASTVYIAPQFGGTVRIEITADGITNDPPRADMEIKVPGLEQLQAPGPNDGYVLTGSSEDGNTYHPNGHFGTRAANIALRGGAVTYRNNAFPQPQFPNGQPEDRKLRFNDQSLVWGGKFDITRNFRVGRAPSWQTEVDHDEHRVGINADVSMRTVPNENVTVQGQVRNRRTLVAEIFAVEGSTRTFTHPDDHWHMRFEFGNPPPGLALNGSIPANGAPAALPGVIEAEAFDKHGNDGTLGSFAPAATSDPNFPGIIYNMVEVYPIPGNENGSYIATAGGQWMNYTANISSAGTYTFEARVASPFSGGTFHVEVDGMDRTGPISIPNTGSEDVYQFVTVNDIWFGAGQHVFRVVIDGSGEGKGNFDYFTINPYFPPQFCDPEWWELDECRNGGGSWDYSICACQYGCITQQRQCELY